MSSEECISKQVIDVYFSPTYQETQFICDNADDLYVSVLKDMNKSVPVLDEIKHRRMVSLHAENMASVILQHAFKKLKSVVKTKPQAFSVEEFAKNLISLNVYPVIKLFDDGLLKYASNMSARIINSAVPLSNCQSRKEKVACIYAEKLTLRVFRDFFIHIITDAKRISYQLLGSYKAVTNNQLRTFSENLAQQILADVLEKKDVQLTENEPDVFESYCEVLAGDILATAFDDVKLEYEHRLKKKIRKHQKKSLVAESVAEKYAARIMQNLFVSASWKKNILPSKRQSSSAIFVATKSDACTYLSDYFIPNFTANARNQENSVGFLADPLPGLPSVLEKEETSKPCSENYEYFRHNGDCYHVSQKPVFHKKSEISNNRLLRTGVPVPHSVTLYAEQLSKSIVKSLVFNDFSCVN